MIGSKGKELIRPLERTDHSVLEAITCDPGVKKISFIAHSLGGLVSSSVWVHNREALFFNFPSAYEI